MQVRKLRGLVASYDMAAAARLLGSEAASAHLEELEMKLPTSERAGQLLRGLRALRVLHLDKGCALRVSTACRRAPTLAFLVRGIVN